MEREGSGDENEGNGEEIGLGGREEMKMEKRA